MKVAVITGTALGARRRTAEVFDDAGYSLALLDLQSCAGLWGVPGCDAVDFTGGLTDELVEELVNHAGISSIARAETIEVKTFRPVLLSLASFGVHIFDAV